MPSMPDYQADPELLKDHTILVTGAGSGIGAAAARAFAAHGATVILMGRTVPNLELVYDEIEQAGHPQPAIFPINLESATPHDYDELADTLRNEFGTLNGVLHNAAQLGTLSPLHMVDVESWYRVMQVNLNAPFLLTRVCLGLMEKADEASILFTSDAVGRTGRAFWGTYGVSKFALEGMMQILADELHSNTAIRVNSIAPVPARTGLRARAYPGENPGGLPAPDELMGTYLYLMGRDSREVTGQAYDALPANQNA